MAKLEESEIVDHASNWAEIFLKSEALIIHAMAAYLEFLSRMLSIQDGDESIDINMQMLSSLSLIEKMHMYLLYRNNLLRREKRDFKFEPTLEVQKKAEEAVERFQHMLHTSMAINITDKQQCERTLEQIKLYLYHIKILVDEDKSLGDPCLPWFPNKGGIKKGENYYEK